MSYSYEDYKAYTMTDEGQRLLIRTRDFAFQMIQEAGCVQAERLLNYMGAGSSWDHMAIIDRLIEIGDLKEVPQSAGHAWQHKIYTRK